MALSEPLSKALSALPTGMARGVVPGAITGGALALGLFALDMMTGGLPLISTAINAVGAGWFVVDSIVLHALGHASYDGYKEARSTYEHAVHPELSVAKSASKTLGDVLQHVAHTAPSLAAPAVDVATPVHLANTLPERVSSLQPAGYAASAAMPDIKQIAPSTAWEQPDLLAMRGQMVDSAQQSPQHNWREKFANYNAGHHASSANLRQGAATNAHGDGELWQQKVLQEWNPSNSKMC